MVDPNNNKNITTIKNTGYSFFKHSNTKHDRARDSLEFLD